MNKKFSKKGFSLTEIIIAVALLGIALVTVCSVFSRALIGIKRGQTGGTAMYIANKKIDEVRSLDLGQTKGIYINELYQHIEGYNPPPTDLGKEYISWDTTEFSEKTITGKEGTRGEYEFTIEIKNYYEGAIAVENFKKITVEVTWLDSLLGEKKKLKVDTFLARKAY
ncbi:MAG: type II secretion system protein [Candidatus Eremiobacterota bacterium]